jgi:hypothetical protein
VVLAFDELELEDREELVSRVKARQVSYFADKDGPASLPKYLCDSPWAEVFEILQDSFGQTIPREPFALE